MNLATLLKLATTRLDAKRGGISTSNIAFAEVDSDGNLVTVNSLASVKWGWETGTQVRDEMRIALEGMVGEKPTELPLKMGGLHIGAIIREKDGGWLLFGYNPDDPNPLGSLETKPNQLQSAAGSMEADVTDTESAPDPTTTETAHRPVAAAKHAQVRKAGKHEVQTALNTMRLLATTSPDEAVFCDAALREMAKALGVDRVLFFVRDGDGNLVLASTSQTQRGSAGALLRLPEDHPIFQLVEARGSATPVNRAIAPVICSQIECADAILATVRDHGQVTGYLFAVLDPTHRAEKGWLPILASRTDQLVSAFGSLYSSISLTSRYKNMVAAIEDVVFSYGIRSDGSREYGFISDRVEKYSGFRPEELTRKGGSTTRWLEHVVHEEDRDVVRSKTRLLRENEEAVMDYRIVHRNGSIRWVREHAWRRSDAVGVHSITGLLKDISEVKAVEAMVEGARKEAELARRFKTAFIATMSHEVRTPLGALSGYAELLRKELVEYEEASGTCLPETIHEFVDVVTGRSQKLQGLVHDLFELSNLEFSGAALNRKPVELHALIRESALKVAETLREKGVDLNLTLSSDAPIVMSDQQYLGQILDNVLSNATKFTDQGSVAIRTGIRDNLAVIEVADTGIGMSSDYQGELFEAFSQEENWRNRRFGGTGLGLTLSKRLLDLLDGRIEVESEKGRGSTFRILLPLAD